MWILDGNRIPSVTFWCHLYATCCFSCQSSPLLILLSWINHGSFQEGICWIVICMREIPSLSCALIFSSCYVALCASKARHRFGSEKVSWCLESSLFKTPFPGRNSVPPSFASFFVFYIFSYLLSKSWIAFLGAWCPLPAFRSCFVEFTRRLNALVMNLWGRKCSPCPTPPPSWLLIPIISKMVLIYITNMASELMARDTLVGLHLL